MVVIDPPYGLKVADWDDEPFGADALRALLAAVCFVNSENSFHLLIFCEWSSYPTYLKVVRDTLGRRLSHVGCHVFLKQVYLKGPDLANAVEVAVYARIGDKLVNFEAKGDGNNVFGAVDKPIAFLKDLNNKTLNPAQKPFNAIKDLVATYTIPGEFVLDLFAGTGQVAHAAVELGIGSVSVEKDEIQCGFLKEFLQKASTSGIKFTATYRTCNNCDQVIGEGDGGLVCSACGKPMHKACAVQGTNEKEQFCSNICKNSVI